MSVLCLHIRRLLTDCSPSLMVHGHVSAGQCRNDEHNESVQRAKKVVSDSPGLVDFAIGLVNSVFNLPDGQVIFC